MSQDKRHDSSRDARGARRFGRARVAPPDDPALLDSLVRIVKRVVTRGRAMSALDRRILDLTRAVGAMRRFPAAGRDRLCQAVAGAIALRLRNAPGRGGFGRQGLFDTACAAAFPTELAGDD